MKALFNCHRDDLNWATEVFVGMHPYLLPVVNKPLIEYWLDFCATAGVTEVLVVDSDYDDAMAEFLGDGSKWNLSITYVGANTTADVSTLPDRRQAWLNGEKMLIFNGLIFVRYDLHNMPELPPAAVPGPTDEPGVYSGIPGTVPQRTSLPVLPLNGMRRYYELNMAVLTIFRDRYVIPGYNIENGIYTGMNVVIPPDADIVSPAALADNIRLGHGCAIGEAAILGSNVIVDDRTTVIRSIVVNGTYLGSDLEFIGQIIYRNTLIDPETGDVFNIYDEQLTGSLSRRRKLRGVVGGWLLALLLALLTALPYVLARLTVAPRRKLCYRRMEKGRYPLEEITIYEPAGPDWRVRVIRRFSIDKFPALLRVLAGRMPLIGSYRYDWSTPEDFLRKNYVCYRPGAFCVSDAVPGIRRGDMEHLIADLEFEHKRSTRLELGVLCRSLLARLLESNDDKM